MYKIIREGNGTDTIFSFDFPAVEKTDIQVFVKRGEEEKQIPYGQFDFNVEPTADNGGEIIFPGANSAEAVLGVGEKICIMRSSRFGNDYIFSNQSRLFPSSVEDADDALSLQILELANRLSLSVQASVFDTTTPTERWKQIQNELSQCIAAAQSALAKSEEAVSKTDAEIQNRIAADTRIEGAISDLDSTTRASITAVSRAVQSEAVARDVAAKGGKVLFVATKRQAQEIVKESAERCGQYYVNYRWLGGMLTNWKTVNKSINRLVKLNEMEEKNAYEGYTKKEMLNIKKEQGKLALSLDGIKNMGGQPDLLFVIDTPKESLAIKEAKKLGIPVIGITDTNANPYDVDYPVPGNDDAIRAIQLYCDLISSAVLDGMQAEIAAQGVKVEEVVAEPKPAKKRTSKKAKEEAVEA